MSNIFASILTAGSVTASSFLLCTAASLVLGILIAWVYGWKHDSSKSFLMTIALLPAIVEVIIMLVNGNIGAGVAVAGAFSLVRFRSAPGKGEEITAIFLAMAVGLATGMGYLAVAAVLAIVVMAAMLILSASSFGTRSSGEQILKITVPESLDYENAFEDALKDFTRSHELQEVKTSGMGSLYKLKYRIVMKDGASGRDFIDELRTRNGNLEVAIGRPVSKETEL